MMLVWRGLHNVIIVKDDIAQQDTIKQQHLYVAIATLTREED
jgi:hypothetical protein